MSSEALERKSEQEHFDRAWTAREASRAKLGDAHKFAGGNRKDAQAIGREARQHIEALGEPDEAVAFGRIDLDGETWHVGKHAISDEIRNKLVINWKTSIGDLFYKASVQDTHGVTRVRKYKTDKNTIISFSDLVFADIAERIEDLTRDERRGIDDALLDDLERRRDGAMRDIVQTIHHSQNDLIRTPLDTLLVIQGGPGTGKTAVALHRVSWLLFQHRGEMTAEDVLVIGPSRTFSQYIAEVLPGLGDEGVGSGDLRSLGPQRSTGRDESVEAARLKGQLRMADLLRRALARRIRFPRAEEELLIGGGDAAARFGREEVEAQLRRLRTSATYNAGRQAMRAWLQGEAPGRARGTTTVTAATVDAALERVWPQLTPQAFIQDLLGSRVQIGDAAGDDFTAGDITRLYRAAADRLADESWSDSDIALLDEADALINGAGRTYAHVVVDEAQDLSLMQLRSIRRRIPSGSATVVGDIAQSTGPWARDSWADIVSALETDCEVRKPELEYGYRVPRQIFEFAARLLPEAAPSITPPRVVRDGPSDPALHLVEADDVHVTVVEAAERYAGKGLFVGIICAPDDHHGIATALRRADVMFDDASQGRLGKSINLMTAEQSKGLEFEASIVVEPARIASGTTTGLRLLYVALTRTTKHVSVVHSLAFAPLGLEGSGLGDIEVVADVVPQPVPAPPPSATSGVGTELASARPDRARRSLAQVIAADLGTEIREQLRPEAWQEFLDALRDELDL